MNEFQNKWQMTGKKVSENIPCCLIAGLGSIGRRHLHNLQRLGCENFVLYRTGKGTLPDDDLKDFPNEDDLEAALAHRPTFGIISNPTSLHLPIAKELAQSGCHLLIEKPISHNLEGIDEFTHIVKQKKLKILTGFQFRFHPSLQIIDRLIKNNSIGQIVCAHVHWGEYLPSWHPWEDYSQSYSARADLGGGVILTLCHPFDYLRWLLGEVNGVSAITSKTNFLTLGVEDNADVSLQFESGATATVHLDYIQKPSSHWLEIVGLEGTIRWNNDDGNVSVYLPEKGAWEVISISKEFERNSMFFHEIEHFLDCVMGNSEPLITLEDGVRALEIALAAKRSIAERKIIEI